MLLRLLFACSILVLQGLYAAPWVCSNATLPTVPLPVIFPDGATNTSQPIAANMNCLYTMMIAQNSYLEIDVVKNLNYQDSIRVWNNLGVDYWFNGTSGSTSYSYPFFFPRGSAYIQFITGKQANSTALVTLTWRNLNLPGGAVVTVSNQQQLYTVDMGKVQTNPYTFKTATPNGKISLASIVTQGNSHDLLRSVFVYDGPDSTYPLLPVADTALWGNTITSSGSSITIYSPYPFYDANTGTLIAALPNENIAAFTSYGIQQTTGGQSSYSLSGKSGENPNNLHAITVITSFAYTFLDSIDSWQNGTIDIYQGSPVYPASNKITSYKVDADLPSKLPQQLTGYMRTFVGKGAPNVVLLTQDTYDKWTTPRAGRSGFVMSGSYPLTGPQTNTANFFSTTIYDISYQVTALPNGTGTTTNGVNVAISKNKKTVTQTYYTNTQSTSVSFLGDSLSIDFSFGNGAPGGMVSFWMMNSSAMKGFAVVLLVLFRAFI